MKVAAWIKAQDAKDFGLIDEIIEPESAPTNVLNFFNSGWGVSKTMNTALNGGRILKYEGVDADGYATFSTPAAVSGDIKTFLPYHAIGQCWYASIGVKYMFN